METLKPGDTYNVTRDGKVFLTQYNALGAHVSVTRTLGDDPETEAAELERLGDRLWHQAMLANFTLVNGAYEAAGVKGADVDVEKLVDYLERKANGLAQEKAASGKPLRKRKLGQ